MGKHRKKNNRNRRAKRKLLSRPLPALVPRKEGVIFGEGDCLRLVRTSSMGWGVVATRAIEVGTLLLREAPLASSLVVDPAHVPSLRPLLKVASHFPDTVTIHSALVTPMMIRGVTEAWLNNFVSMPVENWDEEMKRSSEDVMDMLWKCKCMREKLEDPDRLHTIRKLVDHALAVVKANAFLNSTPVVGTFYATGLYDKCTLINHSCRANAMDFSDGSTDNLDLLVVAKQPISEGSEVFISYGQSSVKHVTYRRLALMRAFDFECLCERCMEEISNSSSSSSGAHTMQCETTVFEAYRKAAALTDAGKPLEAYNIYSWIVTKQRSNLDASSPNVRILIVLNCTLLHLKYGSFQGTGRAAPEHLAYLRAELFKGAEIFKGCGPAAVQLAVLLGCLMKAAEVLTRLFDDQRPRRIRAFVEAMARVEEACNLIYGDGNYAIAMDMALSHLFHRLTRSYDVCMKTLEGGDE